ncbi:putative UDP-glucosyltransferase YjiC [Dulcicalothrix desertica PCC 7102]|uniref:Putative UDP-glucosyltransferase YjiC n=1 Tax=Dulcicalothrix desertica PCC 7102 TaxID=232991 RepID=A0A3S1ALT7_9CYAN|nr:glycosyltransferase [Dulcicalothrix desertica]RUT04075.1 putative UDP-glucosyltransferase YjiC [Dulcicalothrix desertica PCC 7102]TWH43523.1 MGT family glycosyltransferase [Dulcicalothrix desertica PCC 7102]
MTHFGLICPASTGHLNTMLPLGKELQQRGHRVTLIGKLDVESQTLATGLEFKAIEESESPLGSGAEALAKLGKLTGREALQYTVHLLANNAAGLLREAPKVIKAAGVEALLVDQVSREGGTVADFLGIPFITICSAVVLNRDESVPPHFTNWNYNPTWWGRLRNRVGYQALNRIVKPITKAIDEYRQEWKLPRYSNPNDSYSQLAQISQQPALLEFPREKLPQWFHFTGPYHSVIGREVPGFPYEKLTGQPLIYASMGTILNPLTLFQQIAEAYVGLDAQLIISLGGSAKPESLAKLAGSPLVVEYAPQLELLQKAAVGITHGGLNSTLECLSNGVPMVVIPSVNDQPGVAARVAWAGCGEALPIKSVTVSKLRTAIQKVLMENSYKQNALKLQSCIRHAGGVSRAVDIIEQAVATGKPVIS